MLDVAAMYPNIPWARGAACTADLWDRLRSARFPTHPVSRTVLGNIVLFVLSHSVFLFGDSVFRQLQGTAMGSNLAVVFANAFMSALCTAFFTAHPEWLPCLPHFKRYLDDCFGFWNGTEASFDAFLTCLNTWSADNGWQVQFEVTKFGSPVPFLDVEVYQNVAWHTRLYFKPTDVHSYLLPFSFHEAHVTGNIPRCVALRIRGICSEKREFRRFARLYTWFFFPRRGYGNAVIQAAFQKAGRLSRGAILRPRVKRSLPAGTVPFGFPFAPSLNVRGVLRRAFPTLLGDRITRELYPRRQLSVSTIGRNLSQFLCSSALRSDAPRAVHGCVRCGQSACRIDPFVSECTSIVSSANGRSFPIFQCLSCASTHVIYVVSCSRCSVQGVGQTANPQTRPWKYLRCAAEGTPVDSCAISEHFGDGQHYPGDISLAIVEAVPASRLHPAVVLPLRIRLESVWVHRLEAALHERRNWRHSFAGN